MPRPSPPGLDLDRLDEWLPTAIPGAGRVGCAELIAGGKSNLTYEVTDGTSHWILRRPPLGHVLATAHDMGREFRVMSALQDSPVPVPRMYAMCADDSVIGAPFYVMSKVEGVPYRSAIELEALGQVRTRVISERLVDVLADLHEIDPAAVGLADFGRAEGFLTRQLNRWNKQLHASYSRPLPAADALFAKLAADVPVQGAGGIVHGDYRLDNVLFDSSDRPAAVIDWEMATIGDPVTDLALMLIYDRLGVSAAESAVTNVSSAPGYLTESEVVERYSARSSRDLARIGWYLGLASYKLAVIVEGIHFRFIQGQTVGSGFDHLGDAVNLLLEAGRNSMKEYR
ncbi:MAG: phosphotransferase family protein [Nocardiaceae bacterium]|nr:phosphotransferase family protein [Nocardiaceae bacterium]